MTRTSIALALAALLGVGGSAAWAAAPPAATRPAPGPTMAAPPTGPDVFDSEIAAAKTSMMATPEVALTHAQRAAAASQGSSSAAQLGGLTAAWLQAEALQRLQKPDEALAILNRILPAILKIAPGTKLQGDALKARGHAQRALAHVQAALTDYQQAYGIFERANEPRSEALALQAIASVYQQAGDDAQALRYYSQSAETYSADQQLSLAAHNNRGMVLRDLGRLPEGLREFQIALDSARKLGSGNLQAKILSNIASTEIRAGHLASAQAVIQRGLALGASDDEAAGERPFLLGEAASVAMKTGHAGEAGRLLDQAFKAVDLTRTSTEFRDAHEVAAQVYEAIGSSDKALGHLKAFKRLDDESRSLAASASAALVAARFDFANQDLRIARLKEGQLERDVKLARSQARLRTVIVSALGAAGVGVFLATLLGLLSMRRSRDRISAARDQLATANVSLENALKAKTEFLATTSHEIRTPLNGILGMTQVALADPEVKGSVRERLGLVQTAGETMKMLVDDLLDVAKTEDGALMLNAEVFSLRDVLRDARTFWTDKASGKGLYLKLESETPDRVVGDQARIRQVLYNLMSNAIKFTDQGGVVLRASYADETLTLAVSDTGLGIGEADHARIFEPFTQVDSGTSRRFGGTGLGLSISQKIVRAMGGDITVESRPGEGATFTVRHPLPLAAPRPGSSSLEPANAGVTALIIDPNPLNRSILKAALSADFDLVTSTGALDEAMTRLEAGAVDQIVMDAAALRAETGLLHLSPDFVHASRGRRLAVLCSEADATALSTDPAWADVQLLARPITIPEVVRALKPSRPDAAVGEARAA